MLYAKLVELNPQHFLLRKLDPASTSVQLLSYPLPFPICIATVPFIQYIYAAVLIKKKKYIYAAV